MANEQGTAQNNLPASGGSAPAAPAAPGNEMRYGALKCYFFTPKRGDIWGAFCFLFNGVTGEAMDNVFWVTRSLVGPAIDAKDGWRILNKSIPMMGVFEKNLNDKLSASMLEIFTKSERTALFKETDPAEHLAELSSNMRNSFERSTHYFLEVKMDLEPLSDNDLKEAGVLEKGDTPEETAVPQTEGEEGKSFTGTLITCLPIIDPVWGVPVSELQPGDRVEVRLQGGVGVGDLIEKYLSSHDQEAVFPVLNIEKKDDEKTYVFLNISEEITGLITVTKDLRLKAVGGAQRPGKTIKINMDNTIFLGVIVTAVVAMIFIVRHFFF